jgi:hypothetical protein
VDLIGRPVSLSAEPPKQLYMVTSCKGSSLVDSAMDALLERQIAFAPGLVGKTAAKENGRDLPLRSASPIAIERQQGFSQLAVPWCRAWGLKPSVLLRIEQRARQAEQSGRVNETF